MTAVTVMGMGVASFLTAVAAMAICVAPNCLITKKVVAMLNSDVDFDCRGDQGRP